MNIKGAVGGVANCMFCVLILGMIFLVMALLFRVLKIGAALAGALIWSFFGSGSNKRKKIKQKLLILNIKVLIVTFLL